MPATRERLTHEDWLAEARELFGEDVRHWKFECVRCHHVQTGQDFLDAGVDPDTVSKAIGFACIGRFVDGVGCDWTLGGFLQLHEREVVFPDGEVHPVFAFARPGAGEESDG